MPLDMSFASSATRNSEPISNVAHDRFPISRISANSHMNAVNNQQTCSKPTLHADNVGRSTADTSWASTKAEIPLINDDFPVLLKTRTNTASRDCNDAFREPI